jgi:CubicO group peptidase (beta-lactamase class C family)
MKPLLTAFFFFAIGSCLLAQPSSANRSVDTFIQSKMKSLGIPGLAVAVVKDGHIIKQSAYGMANLEWNNKATTHTNFQVASCTKLLTSTLVLKAMHEGKLKLDDPVGKYIDSIPATWNNIKVRHLLNHSSGLKYFYGDPYAPTATIVRSLKDSALAYAPGSSQSYQSFDYVMLGYVLERIYKKPFPEILRDEVTRPLQMNDGAFDMEFKTASGIMRWVLVPQKAPTYFGPANKKWMYKFSYAHYTYTAGGYFASIDDLSKWAIALDKNILFPATFSNGLIYGRDSIANQPAEFSHVGWPTGYDSGIQYAGHSGGPGLGDILRFPKEGYTFIVLSNDGELLPGFARAIAAYYIKGLPAKTEIEKFERQ